MDEQDVIRGVVGIFCDNLGIDYFTKSMMTMSIINEARGKTYEVHKSIIQIHDLIDEFEKEHLGI